MFTSYVVLWGASLRSVLRAAGVVAYTVGGFLSLMRCPRAAAS